MYTEASDVDFGSFLASKEYLVAYFFADWCGPCKVFAPVFTEVAKELANETLAFIKVDVDKAQKAASEHGISSIPTIIFFLNGKKVRSISGVQRKEGLIDIVREIQKG